MFLYSQPYQTNNDLMLPVSVAVIRATNVIPSDPGGKADPYCLIYLLGVNENDKVQRTEVKYATLEPVWDERFVWQTKELEQFLVVTGMRSEWVKVEEWCFYQHNCFVPWLDYFMHDIVVIGLSPWLKKLCIEILSHLVLTIIISTYLITTILFDDWNKVLQ